MHRIRHRLRILGVAVYAALPLAAIAQFWPEAVSETFVVDTAIWIQDTDGDGLPDWWEELYFGGPTNAVASAILTDDGLTTLEKYNGGWNPFVSNPAGLPHGLSALFELDLSNLADDTDGDGIPDWWEALYFGGPTNAVADADASGDGMSNLEAYNGGWHPLLAHIAANSIGESGEATVDTGGWPGGFGLDTDGDGMPDWWEMKYFGSPTGANPFDDPDGDGVNNLDEYLQGGNPIKDSRWGEVWAVSVLFYLDTIGMTIDTDGDGIPDWWETLYFGGPTNAVADAIVAGDGLTNLEKYNAGWNPWHPILAELSKAVSLALTVDTGGWPGGYSLDTDGDGMPDWWETKYFGGPTAADPDDDPDGDGRTNLEEYLAGTNPLVFDWFIEFEVAQGNIFLLDTGGRYADADGDGIPDWWERRYSGHDEGLDAETLAASGMTYREMFVAYLDPTDPNAVFAIRTEQAQQGDEGVVIRWDTVDGRRYKLYGKESLTEGWPVLPLHEVLGDGHPKQYAPIKGEGAPRFFKLTVELLPEE